MLLQLDFNPVHKHENNVYSQNNLDQHRDKFNIGCWNVFKRLMDGDRLTVKQAVIDGLSNSLPRRILDLKTFGLRISETVLDGGIKEWFMSSEDREGNMQVLLNKVQLK